jgi:hypothetical protein
MPNSDIDFSSLFEDRQSKPLKASAGIPQAQEKPAARESALNTAGEPSKKRSSKDFEPDMDMLLVIAQSPMIIEGVNSMKKHDFSGERLSVYLEAYKGIELYIKILERNPDNYSKLVPIINKDADCTEVRTLAFELYKKKHKFPPAADGQILEAYEIFRDNMKSAYHKSLISRTSTGIKSYYSLSGNLNENDIQNQMLSNPEKLKSDMDKIGNTVSVAINVAKTTNAETGDDTINTVRGKDINIFIVKASRLLTYYYTLANNKQMTDYYKRIYDIHSKYLVVR